MMFDAMRYLCIISAGGGGAWEIEYRDTDIVLSRSAGGWCRCWDPVCTVANPTILYST